MRNPIIALPSLIDLIDAVLQKVGQFTLEDF